MSTNTNAHATSFLDTFCTTTNITRDAISAQANRAKSEEMKAQAKAEKERLKQFGGLTEDAFTESFAELIHILGEYGNEGITQACFKYTSKNEGTKITPTDYLVSIAPGDTENFSEKVVSEHITNFRIMLSTPLAVNALRELGYRVNRSTMQSNRRGHRVFDLFDVNWSNKK